MANSEINIPSQTLKLDRLTIEIVEATYRAFETKKQPNSIAHRENIGSLLEILANNKGAMEIFKALPKEK